MPRHRTKATFVQSEGHEVKPSLRLTGKSRRLYDSICAMLRDLGLFHVIDTTLIERYAVLFCRWQEIDKKLASGNFETSQEMQALMRYSGILSGELTKLARLIGLGVGARKNILQSQVLKDPIAEWKNMFNGRSKQYEI